LAALFVPPDGRTQRLLALTTLGVALPSVIYVISNAVVGEITPAAQRGALLAIGTAVASSAGLLAPYIMGSIIQTATTPLDGFNTGFFMCGVIMLVGGAIAMALVNPEREAKRQSRRLQPLPAST
jgi:ACS family D-galactonate transporter-like MFS transporter